MTDDTGTGGRTPAPAPQVSLADLLMPEAAARKRRDEQAVARLVAGGADPARARAIVQKVSAAAEAKQKQEKENAEVVAMLGGIVQNRDQAAVLESLDKLAAALVTRRHDAEGVFDVYGVVERGWMMPPTIVANVRAVSYELRARPEPRWVRLAEIFGRLLVTLSLRNLAPWPAPVNEGASPSAEPPEADAEAIPPGAEAIPPAARVAIDQYGRATNGRPHLKTDRDAYDYVVDHLGEDVPDFGTWSRSLRTARKAFGLQKHAPRGGRIGRNVVPEDDA